MFSGTLYHQKTYMGRRYFLDFLAYTKKDESSCRSSYYKNYINYSNHCYQRRTLESNAVIMHFIRIIDLCLQIVFVFLLLLYTFITLTSAPFFFFFLKKITLKKLHVLVFFYLVFCIFFLCCNYFLNQCLCYEDRH